MKTEVKRLKKTVLLVTAGLSAVFLLIPHLIDTASTLHFFFTLILVPALCVFAGGYSGWDIRSRWFLPLIPVAMELLLALAFGELADSHTVIYAGFILLIGFTTLLLAAMVRSFATKR